LRKEDVYIRDPATRNREGSLHKEEKMDIIPGKVGIWTFNFDQQPMAQVREEVAELEALGYGAIWIPEVAGREALTHAAVLLAATNRYY
jgi:hypothetical protein